MSDLHQQVLESVNTGILVFDGDGKLVYMNPAAEEILQGSEQSLKGRHYRTLFRGSPSAVRIARKALAENAAVTGFDVGLRLPNRGPEMPPLSVIIGASPLSWPGGELRGAVLSMKPSEILTMVEREEQAALSAEEMQMLAYGIAHEIKNPLGGILGAAQWILRREASESERGEGIRLIRREAERINGLVEKMLEMGKPARNPRPFALLALLLEAEELLKAEARAQGKEIAFERHVDPSLPDVLGHPDAIFRAIVNIIKNGIEAIGKKGTIRIDGRMNVNFRVSRGRGRKRSFLDVIIADDGSGMSEEDIRKAFLPFYTTKPKGTGLGLVMARQAVTRNGGKLEIKSVRGAGTTVKISLPVEPGKKA
ncbi:MAG: PAS domain-containing protein [Deltaproteobacteria bacterium]|nr:PAS domain-containing protein [Deltaproteobacteria bacterium]